MAGADEVVVHVGEQGADPQRLDLLAGFLRDELTGLDGIAVGKAIASEAPEGARAVDAAAAGALAVALVRSGVLRGVVDALRAWLDRSPHPGRSIRVQIDGDVLEVTTPSSKEEAELVAMFVSRHS